MANDLTAAPPAATPDDLGLDRAFVLSMARIPFLAVVWAVAAVVVSAAVETFGWHVIAADKQFNLGPLAVIAFGMLLAAFIDGYAFKVPNWCTLSLVMSGWYLGLMHDLGYQAAPGGGGIGAALGGTFLGFALLFPALFIGGMGQGDVKMTMGFGSWVAAYFGLGDGAWVLFWSFAVGVLVGGVFGLVMMACRRQFYKNWANAREVLTDLQVMIAVGPKAAATRAHGRRKDWVRLPYGVPLCAGFLGYLAYIFFVAN